MNIPSEAYDIIVTVIVIAVAMTLVGYFTNRSRNYRSSRNKRARKQFPSKLM
ncbi:hypothetical protein OAA67_05705 [Winogradskyella sp.]|nr:hypothetical protein [Winogradskyella sp.]MDB9782151.1 hypothetical protein [Winogradskyella sp.]MDC0006808.1 hypothetical protein [Winogradskyella sp.]MDC1505299.1 hypothetical protein [Winogradskyella sp.]